MMIISDAELEALAAQVDTPQVPVLAPVPDEAKDRRAHRWLVYDLRANLYWRGREYLVKVCDMSLSGLGFEITPQVLQEGTKGIVVMDLEEYGILAAPVVLLHVQDESTRIQRVGAKFMPCEPEDLQPLNNYIDDLANRLSKNGSY